VINISCILDEFGNNKGFRREGIVDSYDSRIQTAEPAATVSQEELAPIGEGEVSGLRGLASGI
jgi:ribosome-binding protein aMBF1 (putative translation factor)